MTNALIIFDKSTNFLQVFEPNQNQMTKLRPLNDQMITGSYTAVVLKEYLYVLFGNKKVYRINVHEEHSTWIEMKETNSDHGKRLSATVYKNSIFVVGNNVMEHFNHLENSWKQVQCDNEIIRDCAVVELDRFIYVIAGLDNKQKIMKDVKKYSPLDNSWSKVSSMNTARQTPAAIVFREQIFVAGGYLGDALSSLEYFSPHSDTWTNLACMTIPRDEFRLSVVGNELYAVGDRGTPHSAEKYNFDLNLWDEIDFPDIIIMSTATVAITMPV
ncbi:ectoderm-neural cortex protein 1-like [Styela clava]